jgi:FSR family fosmidomycin resistance protein-like MFS transporter
MEFGPVFLMFLGHVFVDTSQGTLPIVLTRLKDVFELNYFQIGMMMMVLNLTSSVIQPVFGLISDKFRTGWFVPAGILWTAVAMGLVGWAPNYLTALLLVGCAGIGTAAFHPRAMMAVYLVSGNKRGLAAAIFSTGGNLGFALGPLLGSLLVVGYGLHATVSIIPVGFLLFLVVLFYPSDFLRQGGKKKAVAASDDPKGRMIPWIPLIAVCLIVVLRSWVYMSSITYLPLLFQDRGVALTSGSMILTLFLASGAVAGLFGGHLSDVFGRRSVIIFTGFIYPLLAAGMLKTGGPLMWIFAGASGAALLASFSVTIVLAQELLPGYLGLASGLILGLGFGTGGLGTAVTGFLADIFGLNNAFWLLAFVPLLGAFLAFAIKKKPVYP